MEIVKIINKTENNINIGEVVLYVGENIIFNINDKESYDTGFSLLLYFDTIITKAIDENEIETFVDGNKVETRESYLLLWNNLKKITEIATIGYTKSFDMWFDLKTEELKIRNPLTNKIYKIQLIEEII